MIHVYPRTRASSKDSKCQARQSVACPDPRQSWEKLFPLPLPGLPGHVFEVFGFDSAPACSIDSP